MILSRRAVLRSAPLAGAFLALAASLDNVPVSLFLGFVRTAGLSGRLLAERRGTWSVTASTLTVVGSAHHGSTGVTLKCPA